MKIAVWWNQQSFLQKFFILFLILSGIMWVLVPASYTVSLPVDPPETLMWGSAFNWGNAKHPPMSGYMLFYFCKLFGFHHFAIFLLGEICLFAGLIYVYKLARCFFDRDKSVIAALLILFYAFYTAYIPKFNANIPHVLFLPMMYYYFYRGCFANKWHHWILFAVSAACAFLSKYSVGVAGLILLLFVFINKDARKVLCSVKPYVSAIVFLVLLSPHILHLIDSRFLIFGYINHGEKAKYGYIAQLFMQSGAIVLPVLCMSAGCLFMHIAGNFRIPHLKLTVVDKKAMVYSGSIIWGQAAFLMIMGIAGHRLDTEWTFPLYFTAGIFIMSFYPGEVNVKSKRWFAMLCAAFMVILLTGSYIYHNCKTKAGYHIDMAKVRCIAECFYREQTGKDIPFITGTLWDSSMLQNAFKYSVNSAPGFDPILLGLHWDTLDRKGALVIASNTKKEEQQLEKIANVKWQWQRYEIEYSARWGKVKKYKFNLAVIPPGALKKQKSGE